MTLRLPGRRRGSRSWRRHTKRWKPLPAASRAFAAFAPTAAAAPTAESASGIGPRSGAPASGSSGRTGTRVRDLWVAPTSLASNATAPSEPRPSAAANRAWRCSMADCGWSVTSASFRASVPDPRHDVRRDEAQRVADLELAAPDLGLEVGGGQPALLVGVGQGRQAGLADQVGLGRADRRDVHLAAAHDGDRDADRARGIVVAQAVAVPLVGEPLVGDAQDLDQALPDARPTRRSSTRCGWCPRRPGSPRGRGCRASCWSPAGTGCPWCDPPSRPTARPRRWCRASRRAGPAR